MKDRSDFDTIKEVGASPSAGMESEPAQETHTLAPDPSRLLETMEAIQGVEAQERAEHMLSDEMIDATERSRWGTGATGTAQQRQVGVAKFHSDTPVPVICQCLPDDLNTPPDPNLRYVIEYGSGGAWRTSGMLLPGMWIAHGTDVTVIAFTGNIAAAQVRARAFITPTQGVLPNIP